MAGESEGGGPGIKTVQITLTVPEQFHELIDGVATIKGVSVEEYIIDELIDALDSTLQNPMGWASGMSWDYAHDYGGQVRGLAYPEGVRA